MRSKASTLVYNLKTNRLVAVRDDVAEEIFRGGRLIRNNAGQIVKDKDGRPKLNPSNFKREDYRLATPEEVTDWLANAKSRRVSKSEIEAEFAGGEYPQGPGAPKDVKMPEYLSPVEQERQKRLAAEAELAKLKNQAAIPNKAPEPSPIKVEKK